MKCKLVSNINPETLLPESNIVRLLDCDIDKEEICKDNYVQLNQIYISMKKGWNPYVVIGDDLYRYNKDWMTYYRYRKNVPAIMLNREEVIDILGNYLRKIKLEKICSKLEIK